MSKINSNEKQNINNIKMLNEIEANGLVPSLFREVKKAKQQALNMTVNIRDQISSLQRQEEERVKLEAQKNQEKMKLDAKKESEKEASFAELYLKKTEKTAPIIQPKEQKEIVNEQKPLEVKDENVQKIVVSKPEEKQQDKFEKKTPINNPNNNFNGNNNYNNNQKPLNNQNHQDSGNKPPISSPRPFNNYNNVKNNPAERPYNNFQNRQSGFVQNNFNNQNRQPSSTQSNSNFQTRQPSSTQNNFNTQNRQSSSPQRPYNNFQNRQTGFQNNSFGGYQSGTFGARKPFVSGSTAGGDRTQNNRGIAGIIPRKTNTLTSASSVFATKERDFGNKKKSSYKSADDEKRINKKSLIRRGLLEEQSIEERMCSRKLRLKKQKVEQTIVVSAPVTSAIITTPNLTVKILSEKIGKTATEIIKQLMVLGVMTTINSPIDFPTAELVSSELGVSLQLKVEKTYEEKLKEHAKFDDGTNLEKRAPIVTIVGHVDHGKTSLLDYIRKTNVTKNEAGGITQKIGAYSINWKGENITFVDTPGHEAFINMRKRGTEITDVAVLIVAGDDGIKPQTIEAIKEIKEAKVPMIVAITKIDKQNIDLERVKKQLTDYEVLPEEWGGDTIVVPVSSVTGKGIDKLLETILLVAEIQELKCNSKRKAIGTVIEATLDKNCGPIANIIVQNGTLRIGDNIVSGFALGKVRALIDDKGRFISKAATSTPVSVLGLDSVPNAGDSLQVVDEKFSKNVIEERRIKMAQNKIDNGAAKSLDEFLATPMQEDKKSFNIIIKAESQGSAEALKQSLSEIKNEEVTVEVVSCGVGNISENDIRLADVSKATIISFNTKVLSKIMNFAKQNKVEIKEYKIIYKAIEDTEAIIKSMMAPKFEEKVAGHAEVRALFKISSVGTIAGCYVTDGKIVRSGLVKILRKDKVVFEGKIATLKREKNDAKEVASGFECGIRIENFNDIEEGDVLECSVKEQIKN